MSENVYTFDEREAIEEEARRWLVRLDGDTPLSDDEAAALREWVARSTAHRRELKRISRFWDRANVLTELAIPLQKVGTRRRAWLAPPRLAAAFALMVCVGVVSFFLQSPDTRTNGIYGTVVGQQQTLTLADGSTVVLNTDSQVQVDYGKTQRRIRLLRGEAHFQVAKDPDRPFDVLAGRGRVRAVGTAFSVYLRVEDVQVTVTEGEVDLAAMDTDAPTPDEDAPGTEPPARTLGTLKSGQTATFAQAIKEISEVPVPELERRQSWREGLLVFNGEPLSDVVREVNRYTPVTIEIADPALNDLKVGGRFKVGQFQAMFDVLETSFGIEVVYPSDQRIELRLRR